MGLDVTLVDLAERARRGVPAPRVHPVQGLLHVARFLNEVKESAQWGVQFPGGDHPPLVDLGQLRDWKVRVVDKLTSGLVQIRDKRKVKFIQGRARLADPHTALVDKAGGGTARLTFDAAILATGSAPARLGGLPDDPRIMDSDAALAVKDVPQTLLVIGGGYIGLELGTVYAALGSKVTVVEMTSGLLPGSIATWSIFWPRAGRPIPQHPAETKVVQGRAARGRAGSPIGRRRPGSPAADVRQGAGRGRAPAAQRDLGLESTKVQIDGRGFIQVDRQRRTAEPSISRSATWPANRCWPTRPLRGPHRRRGDRRGTCIPN